MPFRGRLVPFVSIKALMKILLLPRALLEGMAAILEAARQAIPAIAMSVHDSMVRAVLLFIEETVFFG